MRTLDAACIEANGACHTTSIGDADHNCLAGTGTTERLPRITGQNPPGSTKRKQIGNPVPTLDMRIKT